VPCLLAVLLAVTSLASAGAQPIPAAVAGAAAPAVETLVERALARAPSLEARRERIQAARFALVAADALPDPMVEAEYQAFNFPRYTIGSDPGSMAGFSVRQGLLGGGRRGARRAIATAEASLRAAEQRLLAADLATEVRVQYARLYAIDREQGVLADAAQILRLLESTVSARYAAGGADQASLLRVQLEQTRLGQRQADLAAERAVVQAVLNRLTNDAPETPIGAVDALPPPALPLSTEGLADQAARLAPAVTVRRREAEAAGQQVEAARAELKPAWSVGAGVYWQGGTDRMVNLNVGIELPFWKKRKQQPLLDAAQGERRAASLELASTETEVRAQAAGLLIEYRNAAQQVERYREGLLPQNSAALDATRSSYLAGRGDFVSVLEEFRRWIDLRAELAARESDRFAAQARLAALVDAAVNPAL
jgi:outer membrane protein TolC